MAPGRRQSGDQILAASYTVNSDLFVAEKLRVGIQKLGVAVNGSLVAWDLTRDGKRVALVTALESADAPRREHGSFLLNARRACCS